MFGNLGFSYVGLIFLLLLIVPNLIWTKNYTQSNNLDSENKVLLCFERIGQVLVTGFILIFSDFNLQKWSGWSWWLVISFLLMIMYEIWWIRYFRSQMALADLYSSFLGIPVAGATLPVMAFFILGIYGKVICLMISAVIFGIGHIGIHIAHGKKLNKSVTNYSS